VYLYRGASTFAAWEPSPHRTLRHLVCGSRRPPGHLKRGTDSLSPLQRLGSPVLPGSADCSPRPEPEMLDWRPIGESGLPLTHNDVQHADRVVVYSLGNKRPARNDQGACTGPSGGACSAEPGQVNGVTPPESRVSRTSHNKPSGPGANRTKRNPPCWRHPAAAWRPLDPDCQWSSPATVLILNGRGTAHPSHSRSTLCKSVAACLSRRSTQQLARCGFSTMAPSSLVTSRLVNPTAPCAWQVVMSTRRWLLRVGPVTGSLLSSSTDMG